MIVKVTFLNPVTIFEFLCLNFVLVETNKKTSYTLRNFSSYNVYRNEKLKILIFKVNKSCDDL